MDITKERIWGEGGRGYEERKAANLVVLLHYGLHSVVEFDRLVILEKEGDETESSVCKIRLFISRIILLHLTSKRARRMERRIHLQTLIGIIHLP